jgi:hypothetical protein
MANLSLVVRGDEISAPKRKAPAQFNDAREENNQLSEDDARLLAEEAINMLGSLADLMSGTTLVELERQTRLLIDAQPMLFKIDPVQITVRTRVFEKVVDRIRPSNALACPPKTSCVRLLQSIKAAYFAIAHQPFSQPLPTGGEFDQIKDEMEGVREKLRQAVNAIGESVTSAPAAAAAAGSSSDAGPSSENASTEDGNLERFENNVARMLLFGDVQIVPFAGRASLLKYWDKEMSSDEVGQIQMTTLKMHMEMMFYATNNTMNTNKVLVPTEFLNVMTEEPVERKDNIAPRLIRHILDDMASTTIDANNSMLAKEYWKMLRMLFDTTVVFEDGVFLVNEEAERMRGTQPTQEDIDEFSRAKEAYRSKDPAALTPKDQYDVKVAYIKLFMRIAMFQNSKWSWFANSAINLFSLDAIGFRLSIAQTESGRSVSRAQRAFVDASIQEMRRENPERLPLVVDRAIQQVQTGAVEDSEQVLSAEAMKEDAGEGNDAGDPGMTAQSGTTGGELISAIMLRSVLNSPPPAATGPVLRRDETTPEINDEQSMTSDLSIMPRQSPAASESEARYAAISKENNILKDRLDEALKNMDKYSSRLESVSEGASAAENRIGDLQEKLDAAVREAEEKERATAKIKERADLANKMYDKAVKLQKNVEGLLKEKEDLLAELEKAQEEQDGTEQALNAANYELGAQKSEMESRLAEAGEEAASKVREMETQLKGLRDQLQKTQQAAQRRSSSSSSENSNPGKPILDGMQKRMEAIEAELKKMNKMRQAAASASTSKRGAPLSALQLKQTLNAVKGMTEKGQAMKDMSAQLRRAELERQLGNLGSASRMVKRYHRQSDDVLGWVYGLYKNGKTLTLILDFLVRSSSRPYNGSTLVDLTKLGLFGVGSYILVEVSEYLLSGDASSPINQWMSENVDIRTFALLYQAVVQYTYLRGYRGRVLPIPLVNLLDSWTGIPSALQGVSDLLQGVSDLWSLGSAPLRVLDTLTFNSLSRARNAAVALLIVGGAFYAGPTLLKLSKQLYRIIPAAPVLGRVIVKLSPVVVEGLQIFYGIFMWRQIYAYVTTPAMLMGSPFIQAVVKAFGLAKEAAVQLANAISENPVTTVSMIALAFALRYAATKYNLKDKSKKFVQRQLAKRSKWLQEKRDEEAGVRRLEGMTYQEAMSIIVARYQRLVEEGVDDMDSGISPVRPKLMPPRRGEDAAPDPLPNDETVMPPRRGEDAAPDPLPNDETGDTNGMEVEEVDAFAKIAGTRVQDKMYGTFVLLAEPHKNPDVSVAACAALMLSTDLHGLGR